MPVDDDVHLEGLAQNTELYSGADLQNLCKEVMSSVKIKYLFNPSEYLYNLLLLLFFQAALLALQEENMEASAIKHKYFLQALSKVTPSLTAQQIHVYQKPPK